MHLWLYLTPYACTDKCPGNAAVLDIEKAFGLTLHAQSKWRELGTVLGVPSTVLGGMLVRASNAAECLRETLRVWINLQDPQPSWEWLVRALRDERVNCPQIADAIEETYFPGDISARIQSGHEAPPGPDRLEGDVENVYDRIKKEPPMEGDHDFSESDLENETEEIDLDFASLVTNVVMDMESQEISPEHIALHLKNVHGLEPVYAHADTPLLNQRVEDVQRKATLKAVFADVLSDYYSWFNHLLIENIIGTFCRKSPDINDQLKEFKQKFSDYSKQRISECVQSDGYGPGRKTDVKELVMKVDRKWSIARVKQLTRIRNTVAKILKVKKHTLYLRTVENGCFQMTFLVPEFVAATVFPLKFPTEQKAALLEAGVIKLHCDGYDLQLGSPSYESQESDSEVFTFC